MTWHAANGGVLTAFLALKQNGRLRIYGTGVIYFRCHLDRACWKSCRCNHSGSCHELCINVWIRYNAAGSVWIHAIAEESLNSTTAPSQISLYFWDASDCGAWCVNNNNDSLIFGYACFSCPAMVILHLLQSQVEISLSLWLSDWWRVSCNGLDRLCGHEARY